MQLTKCFSLNIEQLTTKKIYYETLKTQIADGAKKLNAIKQNKIQRIKLEKLDRI